MHFLPSSVVKPFIICDNNALVMSSGEGDFVLSVSFSRGILSKGNFVQGILSWGIMSYLCPLAGGFCPRGILSRGILSWGDYVRGICPFPIALHCAICVPPFALRRLHCAEYRKPQRPFKMLKLYSSTTAYIIIYAVLVQPLCTSKPIARFHCTTN